MESNFLIVGGGFGQLPAIRAAKEMGLTTIVVDGNYQALGMKEADISLIVDLLDIQGIVNVAQEYNVQGVMTMQSDIGIPAVGAVVDALGISGTGLDVAKRCSNKIQMREKLLASGVPQPKFLSVTTYEEAQRAASELGFPCIVKAPDSSGSRGVVKVCNLDGINAAFIEAKKFATDHRILVEEFIDGTEIGVQGFSLDGVCELALVHDDYLSSPPYMVPIGHSFPTELSENVRREVEKVAKNCVDALGILSGPSNIDIILDRNNKPKIIEVGARIGATCLPELVFYHSGIDWVKAAIKSALGQLSKDQLTLGNPVPVAAFILQSPKDGTFGGYNFVDIDLLKDIKILEWEFTVAPGQKVCMLRKGTDRIGKVVVTGVSVEDSLARARLFLNNLEITVLDT